jgi:hypothetical protein
MVVVVVADVSAERTLAGTPLRVGGKPTVYPSVHDGMETTIHTMASTMREYWDAEDDETFIVSRVRLLDWDDFVLFVKKEHTDGRAQSQLRFFEVSEIR